MATKHIRTGRSSQKKEKLQGVDDQSQYGQSSSPQMMTFWIKGKHLGFYHGVERRSWHHEITSIRV